MTEDYLPQTQGSPAPARAGTGTERRDRARGYTDEGCGLVASSGVRHRGGDRRPDRGRRPRHQHRGRAGRTRLADDLRPQSLPLSLVGDGRGRAGRARSPAPGRRDRDAHRHSRRGPRVRRRTPVGARPGPPGRRSGLCPGAHRGAACRAPAGRPGPHPRLPGAAVLRPPRGDRRGHGPRMAGSVQRAREGPALASLGSLAVAVVYGQVVLGAFTTHGTAVWWHVAGAIVATGVLVGDGPGRPPRRPGGSDPRLVGARREGAGPGPARSSVSVPTPFASRVSGCRGGRSPSSPCRSCTGLWERSSSGARWPSRSSWAVAVPSAPICVPRRGWPRCGRRRRRDLTDGGRAGGSAAARPGPAAGRRTFSPSRSPASS